MSRFLRPAVLALVVAAALAAAGCGHGSIPRQDDAVAQYFYARDQLYAPAMQQDGEAREQMLRRAVAGFQTVVRRFRDDRSATTRALSEYYTGLCQVSLGEVERARNSFLRCQAYRRFLSRSGAGADVLIAIMDRAREQIRGLDNVRKK